MALNLVKWPKVTIHFWVMSNLCAKHYIAKASYISTSWVGSRFPGSINMSVSTSTYSGSSITTTNGNEPPPLPWRPESTTSNAFDLGDPIFCDLFAPWPCVKSWQGNNLVIGWIQNCNLLGTWLHEKKDDWKNTDFSSLWGADFFKNVVWYQIYFFKNDNSYVLCNSTSNHNRTLYIFCASLVRLSVWVHDSWIGISNKSSDSYDMYSYIKWVKSKFHCHSYKISGSWTENINNTNWKLFFFPSC